MWCEKPLARTLEKAESAERLPAGRSSVALGNTSALRRMLELSASCGGAPARLNVEAILQRKFDRVNHGASDPSESRAAADRRRLH